MHVDVIQSREMLLRLRSNWDAVYQADPEANLYMSWTWIAGWFALNPSYDLAITQRENILKRQ